MNMKKIYLSPELKVTEIVMAQMLATSIRINSTDDAVDAGKAASREFDYDYEDEEE
jgi:hypothetical protein